MPKFTKEICWSIKFSKEELELPEELYGLDGLIKSVNNVQLPDGWEVIEIIEEVEPTFTFSVQCNESMRHTVASRFKQAMQTWIAKEMKSREEEE